MAPSVIESTYSVAERCRRSSNCVFFLVLMFFAFAIMGGLIIMMFEDSRDAKMQGFGAFLSGVFGVIVAWLVHNLVELVCAAFECMENMNRILEGNASQPQGAASSGAVPVAGATPVTGVVPVAIAGQGAGAGPVVGAARWAPDNTTDWTESLMNKQDSSEPLTLSNVVGFHWKYSQQVLKSEGLAVKFREGPVSPSDGGKVCEQEPAAGSEINAGETVILTIFSGQEQAEQSRPDSGLVPDQSTSPYYVTLPESLLDFDFSDFQKAYIYFTYCLIRSHRTKGKQHAARIAKKHLGRHYSACIQKLVLAKIDPFTSVASANKKYGFVDPTVIEVLKFYGIGESPES
jgi:hypothetical protein